MLRLALWGLLIVAVAGLLVTAIFVVARVLTTLIVIVLFLGSIWLVCRALLRKLRT